MRRMSSPGDVWRMPPSHPAFDYRLQLYIFRLLLAYSVMQGLIKYKRSQYGLQGVLEDISLLLY